MTRLTSDSRKVTPGMLFAALAGTKADGSALYRRCGRPRRDRGRFAGHTADAGIPVLAVSNPRRLLALAAARFYGAQPETMVAVTGTAGKTSVASFTRQIWAHAGHAAAQIGTTGVISPTRTDYGSLTTPDPVELQRLLAELAAEGVTHAAMEASSHLAWTRAGSTACKSGRRWLYQSRSRPYGPPSDHGKLHGRQDAPFPSTLMRARPSSSSPTMPGRR